MLHHMRVFSRGLYLHRCQHGSNSGTARVHVTQPSASCYSIQDTVPHAVFECLGLVVVHKTPGWEVGLQDIATASDLRMWL
jgi:hypothetical protein